MELNKNLKAEIIRKYGAQYQFAHAIGVRESTVSSVIRGQRILSDEEKKEWAENLNCDPLEIFPEN